MVKKYTYEEVRGFYEGLGCSLLESEYLKCSTLMRFRCACGEEQKKSFTQFKQSPRCHKCAKAKVINSKSLKPIYKIINNIETACKECTECKEVKPLDDFQKSKRGPLGRQPKCTQCRRRQAEEYRRSLGQKKKNVAKLEKININGILVDAKKCNQCEQIKPLSDFQKGKSGIGGRIPKCRQCNNKTDGRKVVSKTKTVKEGNAFNTVKLCTSCDEWQPLTAFRVYFDGKLSKDVYYTRCKTCESNWRKDNIAAERMRGRVNYANNKEKYANYQRYWRNTNPDKAKLQVQRRLAFRRFLPNDISYGDFQQIKDFFNNKCALTGSEITNIEHFIPLSWGHGGTIKGNLYLLDTILNISKSNKNPFKWVLSDEAKGKVDFDKWDTLIKSLSEQNNMSTEEFKKYVYWCENNKRSVEEVKKDNRLSTEIYKEYKKHFKKTS